MKKGIKIAVFATVMLLTVAGFKAIKMHRMGYQNGGACHSQNMQQHGAGCHKFQ
ncbi:MAG: hypothetical protein PSX81_03385 [bacterium]|nr:hypothetical protein [bacterium]